MKSGTVVLSDIAASTLGISLFILLVSFALQKDHGHSPMQIAGELAQNFKAISAPPASAQDMLHALYARTKTPAPGVAMLDVFGDRIDIRTRNATGQTQLNSILLPDLNGQETLRNMLAERQVQGGLYLFVFSNRSLNALHETLGPALKGVQMLVVPAALRRTNAYGQQSWSAGFKRLADPELSRDDFENALRDLLLRASGGAADDTASAPPAPTLGILERLTQIWRTITALAVLALPIWIIARIERHPRRA